MSLFFGDTVGTKTKSNVGAQVESVPMYEKDLVEAVARSKDETYSLYVFLTKMCNPFALFNISLLHLIDLDRRHASFTRGNECMLSPTWSLRPVPYFLCVYNSVPNF